MTDFSNLNLNAPILKALEEDDYKAPTPIQAQAIPLILQGRDLLGVAQTGTGKTLAFAAPLLDALSRSPRALPRKGTRVLVLAPTRELAGQISQSFQTYGRFLSLSMATVYGGVKIGKQIRRQERGTDILVATPGRLLDLIDQKALTLDHVEALVLDEADQMLDLGFIHALRRIVRLLPKERQTLFFSATMPKAIAELAGAYLTDPAKVSVAPQSTTAERVDQSVIFAKPAVKLALLARTLRQKELKRAIVFTRTKHGADKVVRKLRAQNIEAEAIHGNKSQSQRQRALDAFKHGDCWVLVATDVAARGIDIDGVSHVINYELPNVPEQYVHRIGRTARAGAAGVAISFVADEERAYLKDIEKLTRLKIPQTPLPDGVAQEAAEAAAAEPKRPRPNGPNRNPRGPRKPQPGGGRNNGSGDANRSNKKRRPSRPKNKRPQPA